MEERIIDRDNGRKIKLKRNAEGGIEDAVEEGTPLEEGGDDEVVVEIPEETEEEYDEDLVGLTPSQQLKLQEERAKAAAERDKMLATAREAHQAGSFEKAESFYAQALVYDAGCLEAKKGVWSARTHNFKEIGSFYQKKTARAIAAEDDEVKQFIRSQVGEQLRAEREEYAREAEPLIQTVAEAQSKRRGAFADNRRYYLVRFGIFLALAVVFAIAACIAVPFIWRTRVSVVPISIVAAFGALCLAALVVTILYARRLYTACRFCSMNEKLSSTEEGKRLAYLQERIGLLDLILED